MDHEVDGAPEAAHLLEDGIDGGAVRHVAMADDRSVELLRQGLHAFFKRIALIGEGEFRPVLARRLGNAPGNGTIIRHAHDQAALAGQNAGGLCLRHGSPRSSLDRSIRNGLFNRPGDHGEALFGRLVHNVFGDASTEQSAFPLPHVGRVRVGV